MLYYALHITDTDFKKNKNKFKNTSYTCLILHVTKYFFFVFILCGYLTSAEHLCDVSRAWVDCKTQYVWQGSIRCQRAVIAPPLSQSDPEPKYKLPTHAQQSRCLGIAERLHNVWGVWSLESLSEIYKLLYTQTINDCF